MNALQCHLIIKTLFLRMFVQLILAVNPLVTYELKICFFAGFPQLSRQSIELQKRSQSGWRYYSENLPLFLFDFFLKRLVHLFLAVGTPLVKCNLKISSFRASSPQLSRQSIVPRKRSQLGWRSCSGELAVLLFALSFFNLFFSVMFHFSFFSQLINNLDCLCLTVCSFFFSH